jgi:inhibitor of KinA sporulation pathway (predicted exonuclease)
MIPAFPCRCINISHRDQFGENSHLAEIGINPALKLFGVDFEGQKHDALADAYNLIDLYKAFLAKPEIVMREYEKTLGLSRNHFPEPVRQVMAKLSQGEAVTPEEYASYIKEYLQ